jgi:EAL domain-containing protein (putative c-di-GMP-specific phosphodiesterase class I)
MIDRRIEGLTAWYQPIVDLNTGKVVGCEVLSRIVAADGLGGSAAALMNELEQEPEVQYALIRKLLESIRREIVPIFARHPDFYVSVNIPPSVFGTGRIAPLLSSLDLDPWRTRLVVELTERQALCDLGRAAIRNARSLGIAVALDDFGTGHSGLSQFVGLDLDILKIDHSLLESIQNRTAARMPAASSASRRHCACAPSPRAWRPGSTFFCGGAGLRPGVLLEQGGSRGRDRGAAGARLRAQPGSAAGPVGRALKYFRAHAGGAPSRTAVRICARRSGVSLCLCTATACCTAASMSSCSESELIAIVHFDSLGNSRQSMYLRISISLAEGCAGADRHRSAPAGFGRRRPCVQVDSPARSASGARRAHATARRRNRQKRGQDRRARVRTGNRLRTPAPHRAALAVAEVAGSGPTRRRRLCGLWQAMRRRRADVQGFRLPREDHPTSRARRKR